MGGDDLVKHLVITGVKLTDRELGIGIFSKVFAVQYNGMTCAAKAISDIFAYNDEIKQDFLQECLLHSKLHHPNIVKMLGVYYPNDQAVLPILVMELTECNLTQLLENHQNIPMREKLSILQDISRAICYLHTQNPPIIHRDLNSYKILFTTNRAAKVSDFGTIQMVKSWSSAIFTVPNTIDFVAPEKLVDDHCYGLPSNVFSFGYIICHMITQRLENLPKAPSGVSEVERRQHYINQISEGSLKQLVITCLDNNPDERPPISVVSERIASIITG